ncbi:MAG TPA: tagaturonate reductase [Cytophagales bacterium]|nr:tagaturonate reductase [Cytophagales bacterium]
MPEEKIFSLPERVLQFGTGSLIRSIPDYFIDQANRKGVFNGRIVAVESSDSRLSDFDAQECLFVHNIKSFKSNITVDDLIINSSISRILNATLKWTEILECAKNPDLKVIISNTGEIDFAPSEDNLKGSPPSSFSGKLTAFLFERFKMFKGTNDSGMIVIPTEVIIDNGVKLKEQIIVLAKQNHLGSSFLAWLENENTFCNSLVDGLSEVPQQVLKEQIEQELGFQDNLLIISESYRLWAIEGDKNIEEKLSFCRADEGLAIVKNIKEFRERKLRLLEGTQVLLAGLGFLSGMNTVRECMEETLLTEFVRNVMFDEIVAALEGNRETAESYANELIDRFNNPFIRQSLLEIVVNYSSKMNDLNSKTIINFYKRYMEVPRYIALGFAAYLIFMKAEKIEDGKYFGLRDEEFYLIEDTMATYFDEKWKTADVNTVISCRVFVEEIIDEGSFWDSELKKVAGFSDAVAHYLCEIVHKGIKETLEEFVEFGEIEE